MWAHKSSYLNVIFVTVIVGSGSRVLLTFAEVTIK